MKRELLQIAILTYEFVTPDTFAQSKANNFINPLRNAMILCDVRDKSSMSALDMMGEYNLSSESPITTITLGTPTGNETCTSLDPFIATNF